MSYIIYSDRHGATARVDGLISEAPAPREGETYIPCEAGADLSDSERWKHSAEVMREKGWAAPTPELCKAVKIEEIAAARYAAEVGGVTMAGMTILTDRQSQSMITGAALQATLDPSYTCKWKTPNGFITLDARTIIGAATAVRAHVQACFDREAELCAKVDAAKTPEEVSAISWI